MPEMFKIKFLSVNIDLTPTLSEYNTCLNASLYQNVNSVEKASKFVQLEDDL